MSYLKITESVVNNPDFKFKIGRHAKDFLNFKGHKVTAVSEGDGLFTFSNLAPTKESRFFKNVLRIAACFTLILPLLAIIGALVFHAKNTFVPAQHKIATNAANLPNKLADIANRDADIANRDADIASRDATIANRDATLLDVQAELRRKIEVIDALQEMESIQENKIDDLYSQIDRKENEINSLKEKVEEKELEISYINSQVKTVQEQHIDLKKEFVELENKILQLQEITKIAN